MAKVENEMATKVSVDTLSAIHSLAGLKAAVSASNNEWKANEISLKSAGDALGAAKAKLEGLGNTVMAQKAKLEELRRQQDAVDTSSDKGAVQYAKLERQISSATKQLAGYESQMKRAKSAVDLQSSGILKLNDSIKNAEAVSKSYVSRLEAEGKAHEANVAKFRSLKSAYTENGQLMQKQVALLRQIAEESGKDSNEYAKQSQRVNELGAKMGGARAEMLKMATTTNVTSSRIGKLQDVSDKVGSAVRSAFSKARGAITGVGVAAGTAGVALLNGAKQASTLQKTYTETTNILVSGGEKQAEVTKNIGKIQSDGAKLSMEYGKSQKSIAEAYQDLVKRGYSSSQALGAMKSEMQASVASGDDFEDVVKVASTTLESFGMKANTTAGMTANTTKAVNELAYAADMTSTGFSDIGVGMSYVGTAAKQSGQSLATTASAMGILSNNGLEADKAGTGLRKVLQSLAAPSEKTMKSIGLTANSFKDAKGNLLPLNESMAILREHTRDLSSGDKNVVFKSLFGTTGSNAGAILAEQNSQLTDLIKNTQEAGDKGTYVQEIANKNNKSAQQSLARFKQSVSNLEIMLSAKLLPSLNQAADALSKGLADKDNQRLVKQLGTDVGKVAEGALKFAKYCVDNTDKVKTFAEVVASIWAVSKVSKFINSAKGVIDVLTAIRGAAKTTAVETNAVLAAGDNPVPVDAPAIGSRVARNAGGAASRLSSVTSTVGAVAGIGTAIDIGGSIVSALNSNSTKQKIKAASKGTGAVIGGGIGAALGSIIPGAGTVAGAGIGSAIGDALGSTKWAQSLAKKVQSSFAKATAGLKVKAPKIDTDDKALGDQFSKYAKTLSKKMVVSMSTDPKSLQKTAASVNDTYSKMQKSVDSYYKKKEAGAAADLKKLVANGTLTQKQADAQLAKLKKSDAAEAKSKKSAYATMQKDAAAYYKQAQSIADGNTKKLQSIAQKQGKNSVAYQKEQNKELLAAYKSYAANYVKQEMSSNSRVTATVKRGADQQTALLKKLTKDKGQLSIQQLNNTAKNAKKEYDAAVKPAQQSRDQIIKAAQSRYKSTVATATREYKENGTISKKQYNDIVAKAKAQRTDVVSAAKDQYDKTTKHATNQYNSVKKAITSQKNEAMRQQQAQMTGVSGYASSQSKAVVGHATNQANSSMKAGHAQASGTHSIFSGLGKWFNKFLKVLGGSQVSIANADYGYSPVGGLAYANGGAVQTSKALVGEAGPELRYSPYSRSIDILGARGAEFASVKKGEYILNAADTAKLLAGTYGKTLPGYAGGTSTLDSFLNKVKSGASSIFDKISDSASDIFDAITHPIDTLKKLAANIFNVKSVAGAGTAEQLISAGMRDKAVDAVAKEFNKLKKAFDAGNDAGSTAEPKGHGVQRWKPDVIKALKKNGFDASASQVAAWLRVIARESNGDPHAQNNWDKNAQMGIPSKGLVQTIEPTFNAYKFPGHGNIFNGYDDLLAGINYMKYIYGSGSSAFARVSGPEGYASGGRIDTNRLIEVAEGNKAEYVIPTDISKRSRAWQLLQDVVTQFAGDSGAAHTAAATSGQTAAQGTIQLEAKLDKLIQLISGMGQAQVSLLDTIAKKNLNINGRALARNNAAAQSTVDYQRQQLAERGIAIDNRL